MIISGSSSSRSGGKRRTKQFLRGAKAVGTKAVPRIKSKGQAKGRNIEMNSKVNSWKNQEQSGLELNRKCVVII